MLGATESQTRSWEETDMPQEMSMRLRSAGQFQHLQSVQANDSEARISARTITGERRRMVGDLVDEQYFKLRHPPESTNKHRRDEWRFDRVEG